ncbi:MAG: sulfatase-like hydrolase/transferase, partial [Bryobacteraceae bacterium]
VTADHGEMLGEHGEIGHGGMPYQGLVHIPLLVRFPGQRRPQVVDTPVSLVDVLPTVLDLAGISATVPLNGMSLAATGGITNRDVVVEYRKRGMAMTRAIISGRWKLIQHFKNPALYDIEADPGEDRNLYRPDHEAVGALASRLAVWSKSVRPAGRPAGPTDAETIRRLRSVGYVQ